jgi:hypothetical protein
MYSGKLYMCTCTTLYMQVNASEHELMCIQCGNTVVVNVNVNIELGVYFNSHGLA